MLPGSIATDSDVVAELLMQSFPETEDLSTALQAVLPILEGAFSFVVMSSERLFGVRDPFGFRPLCLGRLGPADAPEGWVLASETPALSVIGATFVREVAPGEMVVIDADGPTSLEIPWLRDVEPRLCIFEFAYIARPDSRLYGREVHEVRCRMGELLAVQAPAEADMVMGVPESGVPAAEGFARASGIPYGQGLVKNRYIGRSFIAPDQQQRADAVRRKLNPLTETIAGQAARRGGRLHRARHDAALGHPHAARGRCGRGPPAHLLAAVALALLLRDRHAVPRGAAGDRPHGRGDGAHSRRRLAGLHHHREPEGGHRRRRRLLRRLLHRQLPDARPGVGHAPAARAGRGHRPPGRAPRGLTTVGEGGATYAGAGVDIAAGDAAVERLRGLVPGIGGFGGQFPLDLGRFPHPVLVASTDGVGTKMVVARDTGRYDTVGIDLVAMCVDDLVCVGAEPLFMLDYIATGKVDPDQVATVVAGVHEGCRQAGCALIGGETAEHAGVMAGDELDLAGFAVGVVEQGTQLGPERVRAGDVVVGLPSPGLRSNGYTLARHVLLERAGLALGDPAWAGAEHSVADELLRPSVIYAPAVLALRAALGDALHACAHITGGGIVGNLPRALPDGPRRGARAVGLGRAAGVQRRSSGSAAVAEDEMDRVFNRGVGMALVVDAGSAGRGPAGAGTGGAAGRRSSARSSRARRGSGSGERRATRSPAARPPAGALGQDGRLHAQVGPQEQLVHRLQADGVPARGHAARGGRRALGRPARGHGHRRAHHGRRPRRLRDGRRGGDAGPPLKAFSVRKEAKDHGGGGRIAGALDPGDKVVVTEDTVTRGTSLLEAAHAVQEAGAEVVLLVAVVDRGGTVEAMAAAEGIPFRAILTAPDLGFPFEGA